MIFKDVECVFEYTLVRKKIKHLRLRISNKGEIIVSSPNRLSKNYINKFINSKESWINERLEKIKKRKINRLLIFGQEYNNQISSKEFIDYQNKVIHSKKDLNVDSSGFYKKIAKNYLTKKIEIKSRETNLYYNKLSFRFQKSRWGSCSSKKNISLNCNLMKAPKEFIDYVIIHELCHTKHMNHSKEFWSLVETHCKDYITIKRLGKEMFL